MAKAPSQEDFEGFASSYSDYLKSLRARESAYSAHLKQLNSIAEQWRKKSKKSEAEMLGYVEKVRQQYYKQASLDEKKYIQGYILEEADARKEQLQSELDFLLARKKTSKETKHEIALKKELEEVEIRRQEALKKYDSLSRALNKADDSFLSKKEKRQRELKKLERSSEERKKELKDIRTKLNLAKEQAKVETDPKKKKQWEEKVEELNKLEAEASGAYSATKSNYEKQLLHDQFVENIGKSISSAIGSTLKNTLNSIDKTIETIKGYQSSAMARMQGLAGTTYSGITGQISSTLATSPYITQKEMLKNLNTLIDKGIGYNIEQRAFLATVTDKIVTTFDAFDSNLLRLIRLQQADTTAARMGMEASLTKLFNSTFSDTSYLTDMYDTVSSAIIDATSQMTNEQGTEFEYMVQKWLGSLYALGLSQSAVSYIAEGINYLGTGNVSAISGNTAMQTLFAMSAAAGGVDYASMLTGGLTPSDTNKLLKGMVKYLGDIADNTSNKVVASAYANLLGLSMSDLRALSNLTSSDITNISKTSLTYKGAKDELAGQFGQLSSRVSTGEKISNVFENLAFTMGESIADNPALYTTWLVMSMIEDATGGTKIPMVMGTGIDATVEGLAKLGIVGAGALSFIPKIFSSLSASPLGLDTFTGIEVLSRGEGFSGIGQGAGISEVQFIGGGARNDVKKEGYVGVRNEVENIQSSDETSQAHDFDELYESLFGSEQKSIRIMADSISERFYNEFRELLESVNYKVDVTNYGADEFFSRMGLFSGGSGV